MATPIGYYGRIAVHSSLALRHRVNIEEGVLDSDFSEKVCLYLFKHS